MKTHHMNRLARESSIEKSLDAALEVEEVLQHKATDAPSLKELSELLLGSTNTASPSRRELLNSPQIANLYRKAAGTFGQNNSDHIDRVLNLFGKIASIGVAKFSDEDLKFIRDFCLGINVQLVNETYGRIPAPILNRNRLMFHDKHAGT